ncbi:MAG: acyl-ACP desaturase [Myxococcota bacterium]
MNTTTSAPITSTEEIMRLPTPVLSKIVNQHFSRRDRPWRRFDFAWDQIRIDTLTDDQRSAVEFITLIEDHIPGYLDQYLSIFDVSPGQPEDIYAYNREFYHFATRWAFEEDAHAHVLATYQLESGLSTEDKLREQLAHEGVKEFSLDITQPIEMLTYALIQEKATQIFYQQFMHAVNEPVLQSILRCLVTDEARHYAFFSEVVEAYVEHFGDRAIQPMQAVLENFKMPLSATLRGYWRWSLRVSDAAGGYRHTEAYEALARLVERVSQGSRTAAADELISYIRRVRQLA